MESQHSNQNLRHLNIAYTDAINELETAKKKLEEAQSLELPANQKDEIESHCMERLRKAKFVFRRIFKLLNDLQEKVGL